MLLWVTFAVWLCVYLYLVRDSLKHFEFIGNSNFSNHCASLFYPLAWPVFLVLAGLVLALVSIPELKQKYREWNRKSGLRVAE